MFRGDVVHLGCNSDRNRLSLLSFAGRWHIVACRVEAGSPVHRVDMLEMHRIDILGDVESGRQLVCTQSLRDALRLVIDRSENDLVTTSTIAKRVRCISL